MKFEYDPRKSAANRKKHGISLAEAVGLWMVPAVEAPARTIGEPRFMIIGKLRGKVYSCVYTKRGAVIRLISTRRGRKGEAKIYHEHI